MKKQFAKLIDLKSIITLFLTIGLILLMTGVFNPPESILALYSSTYGAVITYFFTRKTEKESE